MDKNYWLPSLRFLPTIRTMGCRRLWFTLRPEDPPVQAGIADKDSIKKLPARRKHKYEQITITKAEQSEYEEDGWKLQKENFKTVHLRKDKVATVLLEDRIWSLFAELGFDHLNEARSFRVVID